MLNGQPERDDGNSLVKTLNSETVIQVEALLLLDAVWRTYRSLP
jgi:hypothetical protein